MLLPLLLMLLLLACLQPRSRARLWLGMLTQRNSIQCMQPVLWLQTALPGLLYVPDEHPHSYLMKLIETNQFAAAFPVRYLQPTRDH
jgi:hypothetical protein